MLRYRLIKWLKCLDKERKSEDVQEVRDDGLTSMHGVLQKNVERKTPLTEKKETKRQNLKIYIQVKKW